jgi:tRNA-dihydrouridine synthase
VVCDRGSGSALLLKHNRLLEMVGVMGRNLRTRPFTVKLRTGWEEKNPTTHKLVPLLQKESRGRIAAIFVSPRPRSMARPH